MYYSDNHMNQRVDGGSQCEVRLKKRAFQTSLDDEIRDTINDEIKVVKPVIKSEGSFTQMDLGEIKNTAVNIKHTPHDIGNRSCKAVEKLKNQNSMEKSNFLHVDENADISDDCRTFFETNRFPPVYGYEHIPGDENVKYCEGNENIKLDVSDKNFNNKVERDIEYDKTEDHFINSEEIFPQDPTLHGQSCEEQTLLKYDFQNPRKNIPQFDGHIDTDELSEDKEFSNSTDDNFEEAFPQLDGHVGGQGVMKKKKLYTLNVTF